MQTMEPNSTASVPDQTIAEIVVDLAGRPERGAYRGRHAKQSNGPGRMAQLRRGRRLGFIAIAVVFVLFWLLENVVATVMYDERQNHLAADFAIARPAVSRGDAMAILQAPQIDLNVMVIEGDSPDELRSGPGHRIGSAPFGSAGNAIVQGHADRLGGPFAKLGELRKDSSVFVEYRGGKVAEYKVFEIKKSIAESDTVDLSNTDAGQLSLITSSGGLTGTDRLVVTAKLADSPNAIAVPRNPTNGFETDNQSTWWGSPLVAVLGVFLASLLALVCFRAYRFGVAILFAAAPLLAAVVLLWTVIGGLFSATA